MCVCDSFVCWLAVTGSFDDVIDNRCGLSDVRGCGEMGVPYVT